MKFLAEAPPNYDKICAVIPGVVGHKGAVFCYGDTIYGPNKAPEDYFSPVILSHEEVHMRQQGDDPDAWWDRYLKDPVFRLEQELEAYRAQYAFAKTGRGRGMTGELERFLFSISEDLIGPMYGNLPLSHAEAEAKIRRT